MTPRTDPHLIELEEQIAETREALGQTVEELAAKVDVSSRAKAKARDTAERLRAAEDRTRTKAARAASDFRSRLPGGAASADGEPAVSVGGAVAPGVSGDSGAHRVDVPGDVTTSASASASARSRVAAAAAAGVSAAALGVLAWVHRPSGG